VFRPPSVAAVACYALPYGFALALWAPPSSGRLKNRGARKAVVVFPHVFLSLATCKSSSYNSKFYCFHLCRLPVPVAGVVCASGGAPPPARRPLADAKTRPPAVWTHCGTEREEEEEEKRGRGAKKRGHTR
jgi:hypothetical protein